MVPVQGDDEAGSGSNWQLTSEVLGAVSVQVWGFPRENRVW